ncbi:Clp protease N-terminal domain-containing protein [Actinoplanes oblitus]|uniref:Clp protease N-terminal domain-containing protein n=1 Tax=Actinoplanes oblitus TaxID=3040509 RepID=A0ABY8WB48_9ACTN|nr:Clp protease N-terminal domain-containing protein [Actinoplanes oblitus]WIM95089.1 Clp protease N-terminal domain-containing protein [Actinoplanes oblitus]
MPKINVYLPDELAEAVRETGLPVSAICQRALEQAVRRVTAIRETSLAELSGADLEERFPLMTGRTRTVLGLAVDRARAASLRTVGTGHLLGAMIEEGTNLALHVLQALEIDPARLAAELDREPADEPPGPGDGVHLSVPAAGALELAVGEAVSIGHNYVGCEHLLLGLAAEPDGVGGRVLRAAGAEPRLTRRAVASALAGYRHLQANTAAAASQRDAGTAGAAQLLAQALQPLIERIERLEQRLGAAPE